MRAQTNGWTNATKHIISIITKGPTQTDQVFAGNIVHDNVFNGSYSFKVKGVISEKLPKRVFLI